MTEATPGLAPDFDDDPELDQAVADRLRPEIRPRSDWGPGLQPTGPLATEDDVRFLIVHHTASSNDYQPDEVVDQIADFYDFHVGPDRGWSDIAYNFLIDRFGGIWEGRQGSIDNPVRGDATGGSQGFALLCSLIGNHGEEAPTNEALTSLTQLLAWLGHRYRVDTTPGSTVSFSSRGSNRWPEGADVTARTISGHRDMSRTSCPGDSVYRLLDEELPEKVGFVRTNALMAAGAALGRDPVAEIEQDRPPADGVSGDGEPADVAQADQSGPEPTIGSEAVDVGTQAAAPAPDGPAGDDTDRYLISAGATMVVAGLAGLIALRRRRVT